MDVLGWVRDNGVVLQSARGPVPNLAEYVAGEPIRDSWWGHAASHEIYGVLNELAESSEVVTTRLIGGKLTLIHRRLWPALACRADRFPAGSLTAVEQEHTESGAHRNREVPFPDWVPRTEVSAATDLTVEEALRQLPTCVRQGLH
jgi:hypothetical protein